MSFLSRLFSSPAARDLDRRVRLFRAEVLASRSVSNEAALVALRDRPAALGLTEEDAALELEMVDGLLEVIALKKAAATTPALADIPTSHRAVAGEVCRFVAPAFRPDAPGDAGGKLFFTDRRIVYLGSPSLTISWAHVAGVRDADRDLIVRVRPDGVRTFRCNSDVDTLRGTYLRFSPARACPPCSHRRATLLAIAQLDAGNGCARLEPVGTPWLYAC